MEKQVDRHTPTMPGFTQRWRNKWIFMNIRSGCVKPFEEKSCSNATPIDVFKQKQQHKHAQNKRHDFILMHYYC